MSREAFLRVIEQLQREVREHLAAYEDDLALDLHAQVGEAIRDQREKRRLVEQ